MSKDIIYREDAIKAIDAYDDTAYALQDVQRITDGIAKVVNAIPSADIPQGEWVETPNHTIRCSVCGAEFTDDIMDACLTLRLKHPKACSVCTARMKGADDE